MATHETRSQAQLELGPEDAGRPLSAEEFASAVYQEPWRYERARGKLVVMAPDGKDHVVTTNPWLVSLILYSAQHPELVEYVVPNSWVRVDDGTDRIGDIGVFLLANPGAKTIPDRIPNLMFETVSPGRTSRNRDYIKKRSEYERLGVKEYVIVDRFKKRVTVFTRVRGKYREAVLTAADTYTSPLLPGLAIDLAKVFPS